MIFASGLGVPEGPVLLDDGRWLVVEMRPDRGCVTLIALNGDRVGPVARTGRPNGLAVDTRGTIWVAESSHPALLRLTLEGEVTEFLTECDGEPFLFPNDLAFGPDGYLYMTDSGIGSEEFAPGGSVRADWREVNPDGRVYRINTESGAIERLDNGIRFTNGIAFDASGDLYVNETLTGMVYRYRSHGDGSYGPREPFGNVVAPYEEAELRGPDGMKFAVDGSLYVTVFGQGDVTVLASDGSVTRRLKSSGRLPTNLAFGPAGSLSIYVTEDEFGTLEVFEVDVDGLPLHRGPKD